MSKKAGFFCILSAIALTAYSCGASEPHPTPNNIDCNSIKPKSYDKCANGLTEGAKGTLIDSSDNNREYKTVVINCQEWMAENMAKFPENDNICTEDYVIYPPCYPDGNSDNVATYGLLYTWEEAMKICPSGWRLPTKTEFQNLLLYPEVCENNNFMAFITKSTAWIDLNDQGSDNIGFEALPAGSDRFMGDSDFGFYGRFWSSTKFEKDGDVYVASSTESGKDNLNWYYYLLLEHTYYPNSNEPIYNCNPAAVSHKDSWFSVRCVRDKN